MDIIVPFEKLLFYSQSYANRLLARCSTIVASDIDSLVAQINVISKNQHEINLLQFSLSKATYLGNMANFAKSKHLLNANKKSQLEIESLSRAIGVLNSTIDSLNTDIASQRQEADRLAKSLHVTQQQLDSSIQLYTKELESQQQTLDAQGLQIKKLLQKRQLLDLMLDSGAFLAVLFTTRYVAFPAIRVLTLFLRGYKKRMARFIITVSVFAGSFARLLHFLESIGIRSKLNYHSFWKIKGLL